MSKQARDRIVALVSDRPGLDYLGIAEALNLDLEETIQACNALLAEGKIGAVRVEEVAAE